MELQVYISWAHFYTHVFIILKSQQKNGLNSHKNISPSFFFLKSMKPQGTTCILHVHSTWSKAL